MICVDASVAVKWFLLHEERSDKAIALLEGAFAAKERVIAPPLLYSEVTNIALQQVKRGLTLPSWGVETIGAFLRLPITILTPIDLYEDALWLAAEHNLPAAYDAQYVVLARDARCDLWTDDLKLVEAVRERLPFVRPLSEYDFVP